MPAFGVAVTNYLPPDLQLASVSVRKGAYTAGPDPATNGQTDIIATLNEPLLPGESGLVVITATALSVGQVPNVAVVGSLVPDANPAHSLATAPTAVDAPDVALTMTGSPASIMVGQSVAYTLNVVNQGPVRATSVALTNTLPAALAFTGVSVPLGMTYSTNQNTIIFNIGAMTNGQRASVTVLATALSVGKATNSAVVGDSLLDSSFGNNSAKVVTTVSTLTPFANLTVVAGVTGVFITWNTPSNTTSQVDYGLTTTSNASVLDPTLTNHHVGLLTGLIPDTNYVFQVRSMTATVPALDVTNGSVVTIENAFPSVLYTTNGTFSTTSSLTLSTMDADYEGPGWTIGSVATGIFGGANYEYVQGVGGGPTASRSFRSEHSGGGVLRCVRLVSHQARSFLQRHAGDHHRGDERGVARRGPNRQRRRLAAPGHRNVFCPAERGQSYHLQQHERPEHQRGGQWRALGLRSVPGQSGQRQLAGLVGQFLFRRQRHQRRHRRGFRRPRWRRLFQL